MDNRYFVNDNQLDEWIEAALGIKERFGVEKALGYLIGEKYYNLLKDKYATKQFIQVIENRQKKPDYDPIRKSDILDLEINLDEELHNGNNKITLLDDILTIFTQLIKEAFDQSEIKDFFHSNPRFGAFGHICSEDEHSFFVEKGAVEHSIETEVEDALIFGEMERYFAT